MIRLPTLFWLIVVSTAGFAMFTVKYQVQALADQLAHTIKQADEVERGNRVLDAEWAYLNRPEALAQMNQRFLALVPIATKQLRATVADVPLRPAPPAAPVVALAPATPASETAAIVADAAAPAAAASGVSAAAAALSPPAPVRVADSPAADTTVALDTPSPPRPIRIAAITKPVRPTPLRRAASLDQLIAQIVESR
jgi:hypothetical protein